MKFLPQTIHATKTNYKHLALLCLLFLALPISTNYATSVTKESHKTYKSNIILQDLDDNHKDPDEASIEDTKEEKKIAKPSFDVEKLKGFISTAIGKVENKAPLHKLQNNQMVYFYGNTGAGKSTIINYLLGNELEKYYPENEKKHNSNQKLIDKKNNTNTESDSHSDDFTCCVQSKQTEKIFKIRLKNQDAIGPSIGSNAVQSENTYPCPYFPQGNDNQLGYCDTAGFSDTRSIENIVCSYIGNNLIIQKSNKLKAICFVTYKETLQVKKSQPFLDSVIATISNLIKETKECTPLDSIFIVLNNKSQIDNTQLGEKVFSMLNSFKRGFKERKQQDQQNAQKYEEYINILKKILKDSSNKQTMRILAINPLDDGTSRKNFLERISKSPIIPKKNLKRLASKQGEEKVRYLQEKIINETNPILDRILALTKTVNEKTKEASALATKIQDLEKDQQNAQKTINSLESSLQQTEKEQQKLQDNIIINQKEGQEIKEKIEQLQQNFASNKETENIISQYDEMIKNNKDQMSKFENKRNEVNDEIKRLKHRIEDKDDEIDKLTFQIEKETEQIEQLKNEQNILLQNITQDRIVALAKDDKNWFDYYQTWLNPISDFWAETKLEQKVFDSLRKNIYNALKACNRTFMTLTGHSDWVRSVNFNQSGMLLASGSDDRTVKIWDTSTWQCKKTLTGHSHFVNSVNFNPSGGVLASGSYDKTVNIWNTSTWQCIKTLKRHANWINSVNFNRSGTLLASASWDKTINIWDTSTWTCIKTLKHSSPVLSVNFNPSGTLLASASWGKTIKIWYASTWKRIKTLKEHSRSVFSVHFNQQGTLLASASEDKTIKIWDTSNWTCIKTLKHSDSVRLVHCNQQGTLLASASEDKTIKIWDVKAMLDSTKISYFLDKEKFKLQTDGQLSTIKEVINHYYDGKTKEFKESPSQKTVKKFKDKIQTLTKELNTEKDEQRALQEQIDDINSNIDNLETKKLEKMEKQIKKKQKNHEPKQKLAEQIQKKKDVDSIIHKLQQSQNQQEKDLNNLSKQLIQAQSKHESLLEKIGIIQDNYQNVSKDLKTEEKELDYYQGMLERKQPAIDLILKIDSIVPMGLIALSFIKKYNQCKINNKHM